MFYVYDVVAAVAGVCYTHTIFERWNFSHTFIEKGYKNRLEKIGLPFFLFLSRDISKRNQQLSTPFPGPWSNSYLSVLYSNPKKNTYCVNTEKNCFPICFPA